MDAKRVVAVAAFLAVALLAGSARAATTHNSIDLRWTAVGDDSTIGQASEYDIRYSTTPITNEASFAAATRWVGPPAKIPAAPGTLETLTITGLQPSTTYWFALKTADEVPNWSAMSNVVTKTTLAPPDTIRPAPVTTLTAP